MSCEPFERVITGDVSQDLVGRVFDERDCERARLGVTGSVGPVKDLSFIHKCCLLASWPLGLLVPAGQPEDSPVEATQERASGISNTEKIKASVRYRI